MEVESVAFGLPATLQTWVRARRGACLRKFQWSSEQNGEPVLANQRRLIGSYSGSAGYVSSWRVRTFSRGEGLLLISWFSRTAAIHLHI